MKTNITKLQEFKKWIRKELLRAKDRLRKNYTNKNNERFLECKKWYDLLVFETAKKEKQIYERKGWNDYMHKLNDCIYNPEIYYTFRNWGLEICIKRKKQIKLGKKIIKKQEDFYTIEKTNWNIKTFWSTEYYGVYKSIGEARTEFYKIVQIEIERLLIKIQTL